MCVFPLSREASLYFLKVRNMVGVCCCLLVPGSDPLRGEMAGRLAKNGLQWIQIQPQGPGGEESGIGTVSKMGRCTNTVILYSWV